MMKIIENEVDISYCKDIITESFSELPEAVQDLISKEVTFQVGGGLDSEGEFMSCYNMSENKNSYAIFVNPRFIKRETEYFFKEIFFHEVGHFMREWTNIKRKTSKDLMLKMRGFKKIYLKERKYFKNNHFKSSASEYFAESFCRYILQEDDFHQNCSETVKYLDMILESSLFN